MRRSSDYKRNMLIHARLRVRELIDYGFGAQFSQALEAAVGTYHEKLWKYHELVYNKNGLDPDKKAAKAQVKLAYAEYKAARDAFDAVLMAD